MNARVLDPCCGSKMFWFDKNNPDVVFGDKRKEEHILCDGRTLSICPDTLLDFTKLPFDDESFKLVVFDPPHLRQAGETGWMMKKYGRLSPDWQSEIRRGFSECFRVLSKDGVLVFKWNDVQIKVKELLELTEYKPLFGNTSGRKLGTHWYVFIK